MLRHAFANPKLAAFRRCQGVSLNQAVGILECIWWFTGTQAPRGDIGRWTNEEIAAAIDFDGDADVLMHSLVKSRWIDEHPTHRLLIHDWPEHCGQIVQRMKVVQAQGFAQKDDIELVGDERGTSATLASLSLSQSQSQSPTPEVDSDDGVITAADVTALYGDPWLEAFSGRLADQHTALRAWDGEDSWYWVCSVWEKMRDRKVKGLKAACNQWAKRAKEFELIAAREAGMDDKYTSLMPDPI